MERLPLLISFLALLAVAFSAYFLFRSGKRKGLERAPFFAVFPLTVAFLASAGLPTEMPVLFEKVIGHSVNAQYQYPGGPSGIHESVNWWVARWLELLRTTWLVLLFVGLIWSVVNIVAKRGRLLNTIALLGAISLLLLYVWLSLADWI
jgi:hypothetical protein